MSCQLIYYRLIQKSNTISAYAKNQPKKQILLKFYVHKSVVCSNIKSMFRNDYRALYCLFRQPFVIHFHDQSTLYVYVVNEKPKRVPNTWKANKLSNFYTHIRHSSILSKTRVRKFCFYQALYIVYCDVKKGHFSN